MIVLDVEQGSPAWLKARLGVPTASNFDRLLTRKGDVSKSATKYMRDLLAEFFIGEPADIAQSGFMQRGTQIEDMARKAYSFERDVDVQRVGLCLREDRMAGASPDSLIGEDGLLELKCPSAPIHVAYLLDELEGEYWQQVQGQLYITGRKWCDLVAYNPALPMAIVRVERNEPWIETLAGVLDTFIERMLENRERLVRLGCKPATGLKLPATASTDSTPF